MLEHSQDKLSGQILKRLNLELDGKSFAVVDSGEAATPFRVRNSYFNLAWENPGISWTNGQQVQARLFYNDLPSVPRNLRAIHGDNQVILNWDAPSSWGSGTAGGFHIDWSPTNENPRKWTPVNRAGRYYEVGASVSSFVLSGIQKLFGRSDRFIGYHPTHPYPTRAQTLALRIRAVTANPKVPGDWVEVTASPLTLVPGDKRLTASWTTTGDTYELQYKETDAPDRASVTGADPALGWVNHAQRLGPNSYVMDIRKKSAVIRGVILKDSNPTSATHG